MAVYGSLLVGIPLLLAAMVMVVAENESFIPVGDSVLLELDPTREGLGTILTTAGVGLAGDVVRADVSQCTNVTVGGRQFCSLKSSAVVGKISHTTSSDIPYELSDFVDPPPPKINASGYVVDCGTNRVAGALITIGDSSTTTNERGEFSFLIPRKGELRISKEGYALQIHDYRAPPKVENVTLGFVVFERVLTGNEAAAAITWEQNSDTDTFIVTPQMNRVYYGNHDADGAHFFKDRLSGVGPECVYIDDVSSGTWQLWAEMNGQMGMHGYFQVGTKVFAAHSAKISDEDWEADKTNWHALDYHGETGTATIVDVAAEEIPGNSGDGKIAKNK